MWMGSCRLATRSKQASTAAYFTSYQVPLKYEQLIILKLKLEKREPLRFQIPHSCRVVETLLPTTSKLLYCLIVYVLVDSRLIPSIPKNITPTLTATRALKWVDGRGHHCRVATGHYYHSVPQISRARADEDRDHNK